MKRSAVNPAGEMVIYNDEDHSYTILGTGQKLTSVTQIIKRYTPEFDAVATASRCSGKGKYAGLTVGQILEDWKAEGDRGRDEGHHLHLFLECLMSGKPVPDPMSSREAVLFETGRKAVALLQERFIFIGAEMILFSGRLGYAGTVDLLMMDPANGDLIIIDWKQNKKITMDNPWQKMKAPLNHFDHCDIVKYGLQLDLYKALLSIYFADGKNPSVRMAIIHITEDGFFVHSFQEDYSDEIELMLKGISK